MADLNFNALVPQGPRGFYQGFEQGQEEQRANALVQQKAAQEQEMNALRMQQIRGAIGEQEREVKAKTAAQKTAMFRDRLLRAPDANTARELVKMQYADPDVGAILSQTGSLEQALKEVPDDPTQFERYRQQEAMGMTEWMKSQLPKTVGNAIYKPSTDTFVTPNVTPREVAPPPMVAEYNFARSPDGGGFRGTYQDFVIAREAAKRAPPPSGGGNAMPKAPSGYRYTQAGDLEPIPGGPAAAGPNLTPKDIQKREAVLPQARQAVNTVSNTMSIIGETVDRLLDNKDGLNGITGLISGRTPGITDAARKAQADIEQLKNLAFVQGLT